MRTVVPFPLACTEGAASLAGTALDEVVFSLSVVVGRTSFRSPASLLRSCGPGGGSEEQRGSGADDGSGHDTGHHQRGSVGRCG